MKFGGCVNYAKNFKTKNLILRIISFILYFSAAGFIGKLCTIILNPVLLLVLKNYPGVKNIILYAVSVVAMCAAVSFFSRREGYNDTESLRFNYGKTIISYISAGIIFGFLVVGVTILSKNYNFFSAIGEYFFKPYFFPDEIKKSLAKFVFSADIPILYNIFRTIKYIILIEWMPLCLTILLNILLAFIFYKAGRNHWIQKKNKKIEQLKQENQPDENNKNNKSNK